MRNAWKVSRRKLFSSTILLLLISLVTLLVVNAQTTILPTQTISSGAYVGAADYNVYYDNSTTYAKDRYGSVVVTPTTNASYAINYVLGLLSGTYQQTVKVVGSYTLTRPVVIQKNWTSLQIEGKWTLANAVDAPMLMQTVNDVLYGVTVEGVGVGAQLVGNKAGQTSDLASGINFTRNTPGSGVPTYVSSIPAITVKHLYIQDFYSQGVYCNFDGTADGGEIRFEEVTVQNCGATDTTGFGGGQVVWYGVYDSQWIGGLIGGDNTNFAFVGLTLSSDIIQVDYINGHSKLLNIDGCTVNFIFSDNSGNFPNLALYQSEYCRYTGVYNKAGGNNNTNPAISLGVYGAQNTHNDFSGIIFKYYTTAAMFNYGVEETAASQNFNTYGSLNGGCGNYTLRILGAGSNCTGAVVGGTAWS